ncbi:PPC domain-containing DNA-binding protein [Wukongibacter baidiensis]|uniref:PPC domain-containing DNA-binding protein n=1 Tax=Wukongibacter baidiensis TaxID=1723361 RepID=UPI003D7FB986
MEFKRFGNKVVMRIDRGEEVVETIKEFCTDQKITLGSISGLGAADRIKVGAFNVEKQKYHSIEFSGSDYEITNLTGNISTMDGETYLHLHITLSDHDMRAFGGHLNEAVISGTCELVIDIIDGIVDRKFNDEVGLNLYKF